MSAVIAASSATGRSDVPAQATRTVPTPFGAAACFSVMMRACSWYSAGGRDCPHGVERVAGGTRDEQRLPAPDDAPGDGGDLSGRLADAENDLGEALANLAVGVDAGEAEVFEGCRAQRLQDALRRVSRIERPAFDVIQQALQVVVGHRI